MSTSNFGERLKQLRREKNLTQEQLAEVFGVARNSIFSYETGRRIPDIEVLKSYAEYFGVTSDYLLGLSDNRTPETAAIGGKLGLSDEAILKLKDYAETAKDPMKASGTSLSVLRNWKVEGYIEALKVINTLIQNLSLLNAIGNYIFSKQNNFATAYELVFRTHDFGNDEKNDFLNKILKEEQDDVNQAINMYMVQKELMLLREKHQEQEDTNAEENKRQE